jgi:general secretion pathway protein C
VTVEKTLTKYFWILNLATLALVAWLLAGGTSQLAAAGLSGLLPEQGAGPQAGPALPAGPLNQRARDGSDILGRNIFDSVIGPIRPGGLSDDDDDDGEPLALAEGELPMVPCPNGRFTLLAAVASSSAPEWSFATVSVDRQTNLYRVGDRIGDREVSGISWRYLFLRGTVDECYVDMFGDAKAEKPRTRPAALAVADDLGKGIQVDGPNERTVDRALVDAALANPAQFARSVRVRPYKKDGEVTGFRLRRIQKGSPLEMLGAQQGDIIHAVNGVNLTSVDQALAAYQNLRSDSRLNFSITRQGKPQNLNINIK